MIDYIMEIKVPYLSIRYRKLCKKGIIVHDYDNDPNVIKRIDVDDDLDELKRLNNELLLPEGFHCVEGRGIYKNYLVKMKCRTPVSMQIIKIKDEIKNQFSKKVNDTEIIEKLNQSIINTEEKFNGTSKYYLEI